MGLILIWCADLIKKYPRQRIPSKNVYYYRCPDHRKNYVMSFAFCFDREDDTYQFAYCYPYTYTRLQHYLDTLQRRNMDYFCRELLGLSVASNWKGNIRDLTRGPEILELTPKYREEFQDPNPCFLAMVNFK
ncbi:hypothetical protein BTVI_105822 [Pitangus sulphuratus]|nr:hypothetical protein BTVI_105822 [Pitangus sulphuratus]